MPGLQEGFFKMKKETKVGFTLIELLVVIAIIGLLAGIMMGTFGAVRRASKKANVKSEVKQIELAWKAYLQQYKKFPSGITEMDSATLGILCGYGTNDANRLNIQFLDFSEAAAGNDYLDIWDEVYQVRLADSTPWNEVDVNSETIKSTVAVWSLGPDKAEFTNDDLASWK